MGLPIKRYINRSDLIAEHQTRTVVDQLGKDSCRRLSRGDGSAIRDSDLWSPDDQSWMRRGLDRYVDRVGSPPRGDLVGKWTEWIGIAGWKDDRSRSPGIDKLECSVPVGGDRHRGGNRVIVGYVT